MKGDGATWTRRRAPAYGASSMPSGRRLDVRPACFVGSGGVRLLNGVSRRRHGVKGHAQWA
eukprot:10235738-Alexandrium_andersonii.AAC.1